MAWHINRGVITREEEIAKKRGKEELERGRRTRERGTRQSMLRSPLRRDLGKKSLMGKGVGIWDCRGKLEMGGGGG